MATKVKPGDVTGKQREALAKANIEELQKRAEEMSLATAEAAFNAENNVIDATQPDRQIVIVEPVTTVGKVKKKDSVQIRCIEDIEAMTLGAGNHYSFKAGNKYEVTVDVGTHVVNKGYAVYI